jgi:hypothetical protein
MLCEAEARSVSFREDAGAEPRELRAQSRSSYRFFGARNPGVEDLGPCEAEGDADGALDDAAETDAGADAEADAVNDAARGVSSVDAPGLTPAGASDGSGARTA